MRTRYLAAVSNDEALRRRVKERMAEFTADGLVFERGPLLLFLAGKDFHRLGGGGAVIGRIFARAPDGPFALDEAAAEAIRSTNGKWLIDACWGGYVAILTSSQPGRVSIVRAPLGDLPCYWWRSGDLALFGSDISIMRTAGMESASLAIAALVRHLAAEDLRGPETCLSDVGEIPGGERFTICGGRIERQVLWSPWTFALPERQIASRDEAALAVRNAALHSVSSQAGGFRHLVLKLSGGLDSSIVAACLSEARIGFTCVNLVTHHPAGDERTHAQTVAQRLNAQLVEHYRDLRQVDVEQSSAARLPRPTARAFTQESARIASIVARATESDAIFDGGGGDNIFCSLQSGRPAADCLMTASGRSHFWSTVRTTAKLAEASLWSVVHGAMGFAMRRSPAYRWHVDTRFMSTEAANAAAPAPTHPWLDPAPGILPGKAAHVALIAAAQSVVEGFDAEEPLPTFSPLICQPLVEVCLGVPSWLWFDRDRNRAVARRAFSSLLPEATVGRASKGAPDCFIADLYDAKRAKIRNLLLGGVLADEKLLDLAAIQAALDDDAPVRGHDFLRIMHLVDAEAWARCWT